MATTVNSMEPLPPYHCGFVDIASPGDARGVQTGTTILGIKFDGGVVMVADSRTSTGSYVANRASRKISRVHDRVVVCRSGSAADTQALTKYVQNYYSQHALFLNDVPTVKTAATLFQSLCYHNKDMLMAGLIVGGWDAKRGGELYSIPLGGALMPMNICAGGSGSGYISGLLEHLYKEGLTKEEAQELGKKAVAHAMALDGSSGGMIRMVTVTKEGIEETCVKGDELPVAP